MAEKTFLASLSIYEYRTRDQYFAQIVKQEKDSDYGHCIGNVINKFGIEYKNDFSLFIDSAKTSLKAVLLHNDTILMIQFLLLIHSI